MACEDLTLPEALDVLAKYREVTNDSVGLQFHGGHWQLLPVGLTGLTGLTDLTGLAG
jgi:hypothetical protein